jgi:tripeptidyl-peptidase-1
MCIIIGSFFFESEKQKMISHHLTNSSPHCKMKTFTLLLLATLATLANGEDFIIDYNGVAYPVASSEATGNVTFYLALKPNPVGVNYIRDYLLTRASNISSPFYGRYMTYQKVYELTKSPQSDVDLVRDWLTEANATNVVFLGDAFRATLPGSNFKSLFRFNGNTFSLPETLVGTVLFVEYGTPPRAPPTRQPRRVRFASPAVDQGYITREVLLKFYNVTGGGFVNKSRTSVGAMEYQGGEGFSQKHMLKVQNASDVPQNPVESSHIVGVNNYPPDGESELDMAVIWMAAANADLWYEDFQGWMFAWAKNFQSRSPNTPDVISISWGWNEQDQCGFGLGQCTNETSQVYVQRTNLEFMKIAAMGTTILVSSGDAGSPGRTNELCDQNRSHINPVFPGGSPWVLSVGATYVQAFPKGTWNVHLERKKP